MAGKFCQLISLPGGGKATLLKILASKSSPSSLFIYLNLLELPNLEQSTIDKFLFLHLGITKGLPSDPVLLFQKLKEEIKTICANKTVILLFDHFDEFQNQLSREFYQRLRSLKSVAKYKFSAVFATRRDLMDLVDEQILKEFYDFFVSNTVYMQLSDEVATDFLISQVEKITNKKLSLDSKQTLIELSGGHTKILKVSAETILSENYKDKITASYLLDKQIIQAALFEIWLYLTPQEQKLLMNYESGIKNYEGFLRNAGLVDNEEITIPLFEEFLKSSVAMQQFSNQSIIYDEKTKEIKKGEEILSDLLSQREFKLLKFFIKNQERIIERDEVINAVWEDLVSKEGVTDQALDQLIFRLRQKIEENPNEPTHIQTIKGRGLKFIP